jgi:NADH-quinone oxidoreductase subunit I
MAIGIKRLERRPSLTLWEKLYVPEIIRGIMITSKHFFVNFWGLILEMFGGRRHRKIFTLYYPEEKPVLPDAYRGRPVLVQNEDGTEACVACGLCEAICPAKCIFILGAERPNGERYPETYELDGSRCIFCGLCEEACPKEAIVMSDEYQNLATYHREDMLFRKEQLLVPASKLQKRLNFIRKAYAKCTY